jgi:transcriptional regulator with XRE-family HTH domain
MKRESFGERLQRLRNEAGLTQLQLAERAGVPLTSLRNWEHDRREPLASVLFKLAKALGLDCRAFETQPAAEADVRPAKKSTKKRKEKQ